MFWVKTKNGRVKHSVHSLDTTVVYQAKRLKCQHAPLNVREVTDEDGWLPECGRCAFVDATEHGEVD